MDHYSISIRLQRVTTEYAYVLVPVNEAIMNQQEDGTGRIDPDRMRQYAVGLGSWPDVRWYRESIESHMHPIQKAPEPDEESYVPDFWPKYWAENNPDKP